MQPGGKKVSAATLKRRTKELNQAKKKAEDNSRMQSVDKSRERKPLFQRKANANFMKQEAIEDDILVLEPKKGKPPLVKTERPQKKEVVGKVDSVANSSYNDESQSTARKSKA